MKAKVFRRLSEMAPQGIYLLDMDWNTVYANPVFRSLMGAGEDENFVGKPVFQYYAPAFKEGLESILPKVLTEGAWTGRMELQTFGGKIIATIEDFILISDEQNAPLYIANIITDISRLLTSVEDISSGTEQDSTISDGRRSAALSVINEKLRMEIARRKHVEKMLRESEHRYRAVVENQTELICLFRPDYTVTFVNDALCKYFSKKREELMGKSFLPLIYEGERNKISAFYRGFTPTNNNGTNTHRVLLKDGEVRWQQWNARAIYDEQGTLKEFQTVGRDITDRLHAEQALRESEERYRIATKHAADGILVMQKGILIFANDAFVSMCGYEEPVQLIGSKIEEVVSSAFRNKFNHNMEMLYTGIKKEAVFRLKIRRRIGEELWAEGLYTVIQWEGSPAILCTLRDITETKLREMKSRKETKVLRQQNIKLASTIKDRYRFGNIVGKSLAMQDVYEQILSASSSNANVVVYGESGTGKELVATAIHELSDRSKASFVPVNCGAIPEHLMESEFFGHKKGAFTGADKAKKGYLDFADRGTLFLDEVGTISMAVQVKLLRAIEGGGHTPLGSNQVRKSDFRIIAATNSPLIEVVKSGRMREDFFFRVHIVPIYLPPLRERKEDIVLLVDHFIKIISPDKRSKVLTGNVMDAFVAYDWPGNVRELQNVLQRYVTMGRLEFASGWQAKKPDFQKLVVAADNEGNDFRTKVDAFEKQLILQSLEKCKWRRGLVSSELGIPRRTLFTKMKKYGLDS